MARLFAAVLLLLCGAAFAQSNGKLQIHYMNVGQGDGAILISPLGQIVMFDSGALEDCSKPVAYIESIGITQVEHHITSHLHADHMGCVEDVFSQVTLNGKAFDRGGTYNTKSFRDYERVLGSKRAVVTVGTSVVLDAGTPNPVKITFVATNGDGVATTNENDLSIVAVVEFQQFRTEFGGDLSGMKKYDYEDIETSVAPKVGRLDVYKVHHHCSAYSTNAAWLAATKPTIAIISTGNGNRHGHPAAECLERLHTAGVRTYWTEVGRGEPDPQFDIVAGSVVVEVQPGASQYTVSFAGRTDIFPIVAGTGATPIPPPVPSTARFAWSKNSDVYHHATCAVAKNIKAENLVTGDVVPQGKRLHIDCPREARQP